MSERYFADLNYSMANEDTGLEFAMIKLLRPRNIVSVCGSGGRALPLVCAGADRLVCVDLSEQQLWLLELRQRAICSFTHNDYLIFWGYAPYSQEGYTTKRQELFESLNLSSDCFRYFNALFSREKYSGILYHGKWEATFVKFSKIAQLMLGRYLHQMFSFDTLDKQIQFFDDEFPWRRWKIVIHIIGNKPLFNAFLYKGHFVKKNVNETYFEYYYRAFNHLFYKIPLKQSFFAQLCFLGKIAFEEGNTIEAMPDCFELMKANLSSTTEIIATRGDLIDTIKDYEEIDFVSMSDVPSYFHGFIEKNFLQQIKPHLSSRGIVTIRSYLRVPEADRSGFNDITDRYSDLITQEKVQMYKIEVLQNA